MPSTGLNSRKWNSFIWWSITSLIDKYWLCVIGRPKLPFTSCARISFELTLERGRSWPGRGAPHAEDRAFTWVLCKGVVWCCSWASECSVEHSQRAEAGSSSESRGGGPWRKVGLSSFVPIQWQGYFECLINGRYCCYWLSKNIRGEEIKKFLAPLSTGAMMSAFSVWEKAPCHSLSTPNPLSFLHHLLTAPQKDAYSFDPSILSATTCSYSAHCAWCQCHLHGFWDTAPAKDICVGEEEGAALLVMPELGPWRPGWAPRS